MDSIITKSQLDFRAAVALRESIPGFMKNAAEESINKLVEEKWLCNDVSTIHFLKQMKYCHNHM